MKRRSFFGQTVAAGMLAGGAQAAAETPPADFNAHGPLVVERASAGRPNEGKVLIAVQPHSDDISIFAGGTVAKLIDEGYTGYLVRVTNDDMAGPGTIGDTVLANERDNEAVAKALGLRKVFNLNYNNHMMDAVSRSELRARFIFLIRLLKADTIICYDPWGHYEENPDHYVTADCVEAAAWMANGSKDYPEHFEAGLKPHFVREKYYFARFQQRPNRIVDIGPYVEKKIDALLMNRAQGPAGAAGSRLRESLKARGLKLPLLGDSDEAANRAYIREFLLKDNAELGRKYGLAYAEQYHYIGPEPDAVTLYTKEHAIPL